MWEELSEDAQKLLGRLVVLEGQHPRGEVPDRILWEAAELDYEVYVDAAAELVAKGYAENPSGGRDYPFLKATPEGLEWVREL